MMCNFFLQHAAGFSRQCLENSNSADAVCKIRSDMLSAFTLSTEREEIAWVRMQEF